jgi:CRISPR-associated Csx11 family protein
MVRQFGADPKHTKTNLNNRRYSEYLKIGNSFKKENLSVAELFNLVCEEENIKLNDAENLVLSIWRKPPSFARVRRVWETTSKFWDEALAEIKGVINPITERIVLKVRTNDLNLPPNNAYEAKVNETKFTVFYENKNPKGADGLENFVIIENLDLLAKKLGVEIKKGSRKDLIDALIEGLEDKNKDKNIDFFNSNDPSAVLASSRIEGIEIESCNYSPVIEITKDPERFMVLVPADKALEAAKKIKEKYEKEMGKVRNRLPMNLGIVYAGYHTALPAIMDAGRRLIQIDNKEKEWILTKQPEEYSNYFKLYFEDQVWKIPSKMGDCSEDVWYPYFYVTNAEANPEERTLSFKGPSGNWLVHVSELKKGDKVQVTPSYFDFEYLSSASQRFEISYNSESRRRSKDRKHRPYYLDDLDEIERVWVILSTRLSNSQIKKLNTLVEEKRRDWAVSSENEDDTFKSYVENVIDNLRWKQSLAKDEKDTLVDFCASRKLADVLEIHMSILKDKSEVAE